MIKRSLFGLVCMLGLGTAAAPAADSSADLAQQVRATEIAFSKTLADRDMKAFARMIADRKSVV